MDNTNKMKILDILEQGSNVKLIGSINGKEEVIELDNISKAILLGYWNKKKSLHK